MLQAQEASKPGVYIIFDGSGSMWGRLADNSMKIQTAKDVLGDFIEGDFSGKELALRAYGHRREKDCSDSELLVPFGDPEKVIEVFKEKVQGIQPKGRTPITYSFREALKDFGDRKGDIILISDGIETCDEDPCELMKEWKAKNVNIRVHVVGFGVEEKAKLALQCIANEAGTEYHDAKSASELSEGLQDIRTESGSDGVYLIGLDAKGNELQTTGFLSAKGRETIEIKSHFRNAVPAGTYTLKAGVMTKNGNLYKPIEQTVSIPQGRDHTINIKIEEPPSVKAKYMDGKEEERGAMIYAWQNGKEIFSFRWLDEVYVDEGSYEFHTQPNPENKLTVKESFRAGDHKEIIFQMVHTVQIYVKFLASGSGIQFRKNAELYQNGEKKYAVHVSNGASVLPGVYDFHLPDNLTPYTEKNVTITSEPKQEFNITVPCGHVTVIYQTADGSKDKDDRCWIADANGKNSSYRNSGEKYPLTPGKYQLTGWKHKGNYEPVYFEVKAGEEKVVYLRRK